MTHRSATTFLQGISALGLTGPDDRLVSVSPFQFDLSLIDLALSLTIGGAVIFQSRSQLHMPRAFLAETRRVGATVLSGAPSIWTILNGAGQLKMAGHFRTVFAAGEAFVSPTFEALRATHPTMRLVNIYGQSESIACMVYAAPFSEIEGAIPVGQPVKGFHTKLVDPQTGKDLPTGTEETGELHISGPGLFKGYFDDPEADAKALYFAKDGRRWFRTRDMLHRDAVGTHTFLRRLDNQVQVNGYRVEPDEIVLFLVGVEGVQNAHVSAHKDGLTAYLESCQDDIEKTVRCQLAGLPHYMRPRYFRVLRKFPVTASGKLDTATLSGTRAEITHA
jgi:acyl-coenzyme A synthetase/AMP-(fatty) acid ligase